MLTQGQGHKVKGQGQICNFAKKKFLLYFMNKWFDTDDTYTNDWYVWDVEVGPRSRSQGKMSRSNMQVRKELVSTICHEPMIEY